MNSQVLQMATLGLVVDVFEMIQKEIKNAEIVIYDDPIIIQITDRVPCSSGLD